jgi:hypothetical protein
MSTVSTVCAWFIEVRIGSFITPDASARVRSRAISAWTWGAVTSGAWKTTVAGEDAPGNACWIALYVWTICRPRGKSEMV